MRDDIDTQGEMNNDNAQHANSGIGPHQVDSNGIGVDLYGLDIQSAVRLDLND